MSSPLPFLPAALPWGRTEVLTERQTGRETFGDRMAEDICDRMTADGASPGDCVATITRITAQSMAEAYKRWGPASGVDEIYMGGGGSYNPNIVNYLKSELPNTRITLIDEIGVPAGAKEALGFALLTHECFVGRPMIVPKHVETDRPGLVGQIQPADNHHRIRRDVARFWGDFPEEKIKCTTKMDLVPSALM